MKKIALILGALLAAGSVAKAQYGSGGYDSGVTNPSTHTVRPYITQQGTVVQPHIQTNPNTTQMDNFSTRGNVNPYTGQPGTHRPRY